MTRFRSCANLGQFEKNEGQWELRLEHEPDKLQ